MWFVLIGVLLLALKLLEAGPPAAWSWWVILAPFACAAVWWAWADATGYYQRRAMDDMDKKRAQRRVKNLATLGMDHKGRRRR